jgi:hypothetical protein
MKIGCVLTACNEKPLYADFIPVFVDAWKALFPNITVRIIYVSNDNVPDKFSDYKEHIIHYKPPHNVSSAFVSQYIRILYPSIIDCDGAIIISDIDMLPMNTDYYTLPLEKIPEDKFVIMRSHVLVKLKQYPICYNVAHQNTWSALNNIGSEDDITAKLCTVFSNITYVDGDKKQGWSVDQIDLYNMVQSSVKVSIVFLTDKHTNFKRINRKYVRNASDDKIISGNYSDYHALRPYYKFKEENDRIVQALKKINTFNC